MTDSQRVVVEQLIKSALESINTIIFELEKRVGMFSILLFLYLIFSNSSAFFFASFSISS